MTSPAFKIGQLVEWVSNDGSTWKPARVTGRLRDAGGEQIYMVRDLFKLDNWWDAPRNFGIPGHMLRPDPSDGFANSPRFKKKQRVAVRDKDNGTWYIATVTGTPGPDSLYYSVVYGDDYDWCWGFDRYEQAPRDRICRLNEVYAVEKTCPPYDESLD